LQRLRAAEAETLRSLRAEKGLMEKVRAQRPRVRFTLVRARS
jgi:hypothetical protein